VWKGLLMGALIGTRHPLQGGELLNGGLWWAINKELRRMSGLSSYGSGGKLGENLPLMKEAKSYEQERARRLSKALDPRAFT